MRVRELLIAVVFTACAGTAAPPPPPPAGGGPTTEAPPPPPSESGAVPAPSDPAAPAALAADGQPCLDNAGCASGVCEGQGCSQAEPGTCKPKARACTRDLRDYCGCDGVTFHSSGSCPGRRFASQGACAGSAP